MKLNGMFSLMGHRRLKNQMWRHVKTCEYMWIHGKYHEISIKQINHWFPVFAHPWTKKMCTQTVAKPCSCLGFGVDGASGMQLLNSRWCSCRCCGHDAGSWQRQSRIQWRPWWFTKSHQPLVLCILTRNQLTNQKIKCTSFHCEKPPFGSLAQTHRKDSIQPAAKCSESTSTCASTHELGTYG